jgi:hypothetical protein
MVNVGPFTICVLKWKCAAVEHFEIRGTTASRQFVLCLDGDSARFAWINQPWAEIKAQPAIAHLLRMPYSPNRQKASN